MDNTKHFLFEVEAQYGPWRVAIPDCGQGEPYAMREALANMTAYLTEPDGDVVERPYFKSVRYIDRVIVCK